MENSNPKRKSAYFVYKEKTSWRICDVINLIDDLDDEQRDIICSSLFRILSPESVEEIERFREKWRPREVDWYYAMRENRVIKNRIDYEMSAEGSEFRRSRELTPINMETKLVFDE